MGSAPEQAIQKIALRSWDVFKKDPVLYIVASLIVAVVGSVTLGILAPPLAVGFIKLTRDRMAGKEVGAGDVFGGLGSFVTSLIVGIIVMIGVMIGSMLLVLPGLAVALVTCFAFHFIAYDDAGIGDALGKSFNLVKDNILPVIIIIVAVGVLNSIGSMVVVGVLLTGPLSMVAMTVAFEELRRG